MVTVQEVQKAIRGNRDLATIVVSLDAVEKVGDDGLSTKDVQLHRLVDRDVD